MAKVLLKRSKRVNNGVCRFCKEQATSAVFTVSGVWRVCASCRGKRWALLDLLEAEYFEG